jgi:hypothetical protein
LPRRHYQPPARRCHRIRRSCRRCRIIPAAASCANPAAVTVVVAQQQVQWAVRRSNTITTPKTCHLCSNSQLAALLLAAAHIAELFSLDPQVYCYLHCGVCWLITL